MSVDISVRKKLGEFDIDIAIKSGAKCIGILGPSGSGKSMLLKIIAGIETPDEGLVKVDGRVLFDSSNRINQKPQERSVGYMFQEYALFPTMTVAQNIAAGIKAKKDEAKRRVNEIVKDYDLEGLEQKLPSQLSGGQKQRVALARMMAYEPHALLFDEPFSAMDVSLKQDIRQELMSAIKQYDRTSIIVTHDRDDAIMMCDWLVIIDQGRLLASGYTNQLITNPPSQEVSKILGCDSISRIEQEDGTIRLARLEIVK